MLAKKPQERITLQEIKVSLKAKQSCSGSNKMLIFQIHPWVTRHGMYPMMDQNSNCSLIEVTEDEVENCVRSVPKLDTLILIKVGKRNKGKAA